MTDDYTLSIVRGEQPDANGVELGQSDLQGVDLGAGVWDWMTQHGVGQDDLTWVLVTPCGENPGEIANLVAQRDLLEVDLGDSLVTAAGHEDDSVGWEEAIEASLVQLGDDLDR